MSAPAACPRCGLNFQAGFIADDGSSGGTITFKDVITECPGCKEAASITDGTYELVGNVLRALQAPGIAREDVLAFQAVAKAVQTGSLSRTRAAELSEAIGAPFGILWAWLNADGTAIGVVLAIITIWITLSASLSSDEASGQAHVDVQTLTQAVLAETRLQQKIYGELQRRFGQPALRADQEKARNKVLPERNRHQRRKAAAISAKKK